MRDRLSQLFRLHPGEGGLVLALGLILLGNAMATHVSNVAAVSGFLSEGGVNQILLVWLVDMILILMTAGLQSLIVDRFDRITLMRWMSFALGMIFIFLRLMFTLRVPGWLNYSILYLLSDQQWLFFPLVFWVLANDVFDITQTKRVFPLIASFGFAGQILGLVVAAFSPQLFAFLNIPSTELLTLNVLIYLLVFVIISAGLRVKTRETARKHETVRETLNEGWSFIREVPSFRFLTMSILALTLCDTIIEFRFLVVSDSAFHDPSRFQTFFSLYRLGVIVCAIAMQSFLTSRLIEKVGLKNSFFILPVALLSGVGWMLALPNLISSTGAMVLLKLSRDTVDESARKSFQALVPEERRGRVSVFMDSYLLATGTILGSLITGLIVILGVRLGDANYFYAYLAVAAVAALFAIWAVFKLRSVYDSSLLNWRLKRRQRGASVLSKLEF